MLFLSSETVIKVTFVSALKTNPNPRLNKAKSAPANSIMKTLNKSFLAYDCSQIFIENLLKSLNEPQFTKEILHFTAAFFSFFTSSSFCFCKATF